MSAPEKYKKETFRRELATLYEKHYQLMYRAAYGVTRSRQDAEDVVQGVFLKLIAEPPSPDFIKNPPGYLYRTAINTALKTVRSRERRKTVDVDSIEIPGPAFDPVRQEQIWRLEEAMKQLKPEYVEILQLHYKEGYSCREIAKKLRR